MADTADASGSSDGSTIPFDNLNKLCQPYVQMNKRRPAAGLLARLRNLLRRGREDDETTEELHFHLEMETEKNVRAGMAPGEARRQARLMASARGKRFVPKPDVTNPCSQAFYRV